MVKTSGWIVAWNQVRTASLFFCFPKAEMSRVPVIANVEMLRFARMAAMRKLRGGGGRRYERLVRPSCCWPIT